MEIDKAEKRTLVFAVAREGYAGNQLEDIGCWFVGRLRIPRTAQVERYLTRLVTSRSLVVRKVFVCRSVGIDPHSSPGEEEWAAAADEQTVQR